MLAVKNLQVSGWGGSIRFRARPELVCCVCEVMLCEVNVLQSEDRYYF